MEIYVAPTYDSGDGWLTTMRHIALEGRCWVLGSGTVLRGDDVPEDFPARVQLFPDPEEWINDGDSVVIDPAGKVVAGPLHQKAGVLYADIDTARGRTNPKPTEIQGVKP